MPSFSTGPTADLQPGVELQACLLPRRGGPIELREQLAVPERTGHIARLVRGISAIATRRGRHELVERDARHLRRGVVERGADAGPCLEHGAVQLDERSKRRLVNERHPRTATEQVDGPPAGRPAARDPGALQSQNPARDQIHQPELEDDHGRDLFAQPVSQPVGFRRGQLPRLVREPRTADRRTAAWADALRVDINTTPMAGHSGIVSAPCRAPQGA